MNVIVSLILEGVAILLSLPLIIKPLKNCYFRVLLAILGYGSTLLCAYAVINNFPLYLSIIWGVAVICDLIDCFTQEKCAANSFLPYVIRVTVWAIISMSLKVLVLIISFFYL